MGVVAAVGSSLRAADACLLGLWERVPYTHDVTQIQRALDRAIVEGVISHSVKPAANLWIQECKKIRKEAFRLDADGCYYLFHVHAADQPNPSARSIALYALINDGDFGCLQLEPILAAAKSLKAWAQENPAARPAEPQNVVPKSEDRTLGCRVKALEEEAKSQTKKKKPQTAAEKLRERRNKFSASRRKKGWTWSKIFDNYNEKYPDDKKASPGALRLSFNRNPEVR